MLTLFLSQTHPILAQSTFATKIGAQWLYSFNCPDGYDFSLPDLTSNTGLLQVNYTKDTTIGALTMKKFEQKGARKFKDNDTTFRFTKPPFFMVQRNDTVFIRQGDTLTLDFLYKTKVGDTFNMKTNRRAFDINSVLQSVRDTTALNKTTPRLKKYTYTTRILVTDTDYPSPLNILDRIGPMDSELYVHEQGTSNGGYYYYNLVCYTDSEVGELKFSTRDCNALVADQDLSVNPSKDFSFTNPAHDQLSISLNENIAKSLKEITIYNLMGAKIKTISPTQQSEYQIDISSLSNGVYFIQCSFADGIATKKVIINH